MNELLVNAGFMAGLQLAGCLVMRPLVGRVPGALILLGGVLWGQLLWVVAGCLVLAGGVPYGAWSVGGLTVTAAVVSALWSARRVPFGGREVMLALAGAAWVASVGWVFTINNGTALSYDSFVQINLANVFVDARGVDPLIHPAIASWGIFLLVVQSGGRMFGLDYLAAAGPTAAVSFLAVFAWMSARGLRSLGVGAIWAAISAGLAVGVLASTYFVVFQAFYIHNGLLSAVYLTLFIGLAWLALRENEPAYLVPGVAALIAVALLRTEAPLIAVIFLVLLLAEDALPVAVRRRSILGFGIPVLAWYTWLVSTIGSGTDILTPDRAAIIMGAVAALTGLSLVAGRRPFDRLVRWLPGLMLAALVLVLAGCLTLKYHHMVGSLRVMVTNLTTNGRWGATWIGLAMALTLAAALPAPPQARLLRIGLVCHVLLVWALVVFRGPYRAGWGDSANRIMTQVLPGGILYLLLKLAPAVALGLPRTPSVRRFAPAAMLTLTLGASLFLQFTKPSDLAVGANLVGGPTFRVPPSYGESHGIEVALRGLSDERYAAVDELGPANVVLDLGRDVRAPALLIQEYAAELALLDFALEVSRNGRDWYAVFDARRPDRSRAVDHGHGCWAFDSRSAGKFRYLALRHRLAAGPHNLLTFRRIGVLSRGFWALRGGQEVDRLHDYAVLARPVDPPVFRMPPFYPEPHDVSLVLRGIVDHEYMAAEHPGPAQLTLDLGRQVRPEVLLMAEHSRALKLLNYAWSVSSDGQAWTPVFDAARPELAGGYVAEPGSWAWDLRQAGPLRYVRLDYRRGAGPDFLALRRIGVLAHDPGYLIPDRRVPDVVAATQPAISVP